MSKERVFSKKFIKTSAKKVKKHNNRYQGLDNDTLNKKERINNNNMIISRINQDI